MKKLLLASMLMVGINSYATMPEQPRSLTFEEQAMIQGFYDKLGARYAELGMHAEVADALQEVADENRAEFEAVRDLLGATLEDGTPAFIVNVAFALQ